MLDAPSSHASYASALEAWERREAASNAAAAAAVTAAVRTARDLAALPATLADAESALHAAQASLESAVRRTLGELHTGLALLGGAVRGVGEEDATLRELGGEATQCAAFLGVGRTHMASQLAAARANLREAVAAAEDVLGVPEEADVVARAVADEDDLVVAYERVEMLTRRAQTIRRALDDGGDGTGSSPRANEDDEDLSAEVLDDYFARARAVRSEFDARLMEHCGQFLELAPTQPHRLVNALQTVVLADAVGYGSGDSPNGDSGAQQQCQSGGATDGAPAEADCMIDAGALSPRQSSNSLPDVPIVDLTALLGVGGGESTADSATSDATQALQAQTQAACGGGCEGSSMQTQTYRQRCFAAMRGGVTARFKVAHTALDTSAGCRLEVRPLLEVLDARVGELVDVYDIVAPCYPPHFNAFESIAAMYREEVRAVLRELAARARDELGNGALIDILEWSAAYAENLTALGVEVDSGFFSGHGDGLTDVVEEYIRRMRSAVGNWFANMLRADFSDTAKAAKIDTDGRCSTPLPVDVFRVVDEQMGLAARSRSAELMELAAKALAEELSALAVEARRLLEGAASASAAFSPSGAAAAAQSDAPSTSPPLEFVAAQANNAFVMHDLAADWLDLLENSLDEAALSALNGESVLRQLAALGDLAVRLVAREVYSDMAFDAAIRGFFTTREWREGGTVATVAATMDDYLADLTAFLAPTAYRRLLPPLFESLTARYVERWAAAYPIESGAEGSAAVERDVEELSALYNRHLPSNRAQDILSAVDALCDLLRADGAEAFIIEYTTAVRHHPECSPMLIERTLQANARIKKKFKAETMAECRRIYEAHGAGGGGAAGASAPSDGTAPKSVFGKATAMHALGAAPGVELPNVTAILAAAKFKRLGSRNRERAAK